MKKPTTILISYLCFVLLASEGCDDINTAPKSASGVSKATTSVQTDLTGRTVEQNNIIERLKMDNLPGSIKHLYIMSAYSGQVLIYSTVHGKVTSSGKRLTPTSVTDREGWANRVEIAGNTYTTSEILQDDGTYGSSVDYIYWWDSKGVYHQQYITGGMIVHISNQPIAAKSVTINMEEVK